MGRNWRKMTSIRQRPVDGFAATLARWERRDRLSNRIQWACIVLVVICIAILIVI
jgi:hypothetical protein